MGYLEAFALKPSQVGKLIGKEVTPVKNMKYADIPSDGQYAIDKFPQLKEYGYLRMINDELEFKVAFGTPGKRIIT